MKAGFDFKLYKSIDECLFWIIGRFVLQIIEIGNKKSGLFEIPVAEFKEFERRFKFKPRLKYGWFHLKLYQMF